MAFDQPTRNRLARFVGEARALLSEEFTRQLQHEYGLDPTTGHAVELDCLTHLDDARRETARILRETLAHYLAGAAKPTAQARRDALDRIVREQAYTVLNRLCALRMAEARGLLIESVGRGYQSRGFQLYARLAGTALGETGEAYRGYLFSLFDELAVDLAVLFDRFNPQGRLFPREAALLRLLDAINHPDIEPLWAEDETIGWIYQYFNSDDERRQMRAESQAPRNSRELAVRNQFFTPRYVVEFLTDNTLGRLWYEMTQGQTALVDTCRYLVRRPNEIFMAPGAASPRPQGEEDSGGEGLSQEELLRQPVYIPHRPLKDPREIAMLDPACGSMHFGLYAFDLFERIYAEAWEMQASGRWAELGGQTDDRRLLTAEYPSKEAFLRDVPRLIVERNIHGIDIDPRAVQIAGLSLWLRAQRSWQAQGLKPQERPQIRRSNIVCAEPMPGDKDLLDEFLKSLRDDRLEALIRRVLAVPAGQRVRATERMAEVLCDLVRTVWQEMALAGEAGSLLKIEESLAEAVAQAEKEWQDRWPLFRAEFQLTEGTPQVRYYRTVPGEGADFWSRTEALVLAALEEYAEQAQNGVGYQRRLFAEDAVRGFAFTDLCRRKYDVVLMNPPFGLSTEMTRGYIERLYPNSKSDIAAVIVERGIFALVEGGFLGAITTRNLLVLPTYSDWRIDLMLRDGKLVTLADLGYGVLDNAMVEAAAYVVGPQSTKLGSFFSCLQSVDKGKALCEVVGSTALGIRKDGSFFAQPQQFQRLPEAVIAYTIPERTLSRVLKWKSLKDIGVVAYKGLNTSDDPRFLRLAWEIPPSCTDGTCPWRHFAKGGEWNPFWDDIYLLVNWTRSGEEILVSGGTIRNIGHYFRHGLTYPERTTSSFGPRVLPKECVFSTAGLAILFDSDLDPFVYLGLLLSRPGQYLIEMSLGGGDSSSSGTAARHYTNGMLNRLPFPSVPKKVTNELTALVREIVDLKREMFSSDETSRDFVCIPLIGENILKNARQQETNRLKRLVQISSKVAQLEAIALEVSDFDSALGKAALDNLVGPSPHDYTATNYVEALSLKELDDSELIRRLVDKTGSGARYITKNSQLIDRKLELLAHLSEANATDLANFFLQNISVTSQQIQRTAIDVISFAVGTVFGRWDVHFATGEKSTPQLPDPFAPLQFCSPGMLQSNQGLPAMLDDVPVEYPLCISWSGILVDDEGHSEDVESCIREALRAIWPARADAVEQEACEILGVSSLRAFFGDPNRFFDDHLKRYSKSRRCAPIYWPLSTSSGAYTLWLYYHRLSDQILYTCVNDFIDPKLDQVRQEADQLRQRSGRNREQERELEQLTDLALELQDYRDELLRIAAFWKPDLDDGVQITAAPLWRLFQHREWQKRLQETWDTLSAGDHDWAHLAMSIWPARVVPKCVDDRSLAIAHDLEDLFWVEDVNGWRNLRAPEQEIADQKQRRQALSRDLLRDLLAELAGGPGRGLPAYQVSQHLVEGDWDDLPVALCLWPERVAEKCWADPPLSLKLGLDMPARRTETARKRFVAELAGGGTPDLAAALVAALQEVELPFDALWAELERGNRDGEALALALWPDRVVDKCVTDVDLAARHDLRRFFWYKPPHGDWRRRKDPKREMADEIARRQTNTTRAGG